MATTLKDIARDVGVSIITVSKALRNHIDVSDETRKKILDRAKALNYSPNLTARSLVTGRSYLVGLVVPDLLHTFFAQVAKSLSSTLLESGYSLIISTSDEDPDLEKRILDRLLSRRVDALIMASASTSSSDLQRLVREGPPFILIDRCFDELDANYIGANDEVVGSLATGHLIEIGCRRIAHLRGPESSVGRGRLNGYRKALAKYKMPQLPGHISPQRPADVGSTESGRDLMRQLLRLNPPPDGVFAYNDAMAIGAMHEILDAGLRIPEDIAIIGSGNLHYGSELRIPLSSIDQQTELIGVRAARLTLAMLESKEKVRHRKVIIPPRIVVRASTQRQT